MKFKIMSKINLTMEKLQHSSIFLANQIIIFSMAAVASTLCATQVESMALKISNIVVAVISVLAIWYLKAKIKCDIKNADTELENFVNVAIEHQDNVKEMQEAEEKHIPNLF